MRTPYIESIMACNTWPNMPITAHMAISILTVRVFEKTDFAPLKHLLDHILEKTCDK